MKIHQNSKPMRHMANSAIFLGVSMVSLPPAAARADDALPNERTLPQPGVASPKPDPVSYAPTLDERLQAIPVPGATYVGFESKFTTLAGGSGLLVGAQSGWSLDPHVVIGLAGYGLVSGFSGFEVDGSSRSVELAYGGFRAAYIIRPRARFHVTLSALAGLGSVGTSTRDPATGAAGRAWVSRPPRPGAGDRGRDERVAGAPAGTNRFVPVPVGSGPPRSRQCHGERCRGGRRRQSGNVLKFRGGRPNPDGLSFPAARS